jgi:hypothetical protein
MALYLVQHGINATKDVAPEKDRPFREELKLSVLLKWSKATVLELKR